MAQGRCVGRQELTNKQIKNQCCPGCPVRKICFTEGVAYGEIGTWGGLTEGERRALPAELKRKIIFELLDSGQFQHGRSGSITTNRYVQEYEEDQKLKKALVPVPSFSFRDL